MGDDYDPLPVEVDLMGMFLNEEVYITASQSYNDLEFQPVKALGSKEGPTEKYGGFKEEEEDFILELIFANPIRIDGYGLKMADEGFNPAEWSVVIDETDQNGDMHQKYNVTISYVTDIYKQYAPWEQFKQIYETPYHINKLTLKVHKTYLNQNQCQIGQLILYSKNKELQNQPSYRHLVQMKNI